MVQTSRSSLGDASAGSHPGPDRPKQQKKRTKISRQFLITQFPLKNRAKATKIYFIKHVKGFMVYEDR
jgi:hypothetical protein